MENKLIVAIIIALCICVVLSLSLLEKTSNELNKKAEIIQRQLEVEREKAKREKEKTDIDTACLVRNLCREAIEKRDMKKSVEETTKIIFTMSQKLAEADVAMGGQIQLTKESASLADKLKTELKAQKDITSNVAAELQEKIEKLEADKLANQLLTEFELDNQRENQRELEAKSKSLQEKIEKLESDVGHVSLSNEIKKLKDEKVENQQLRKKLVQTTRDYIAQRNAQEAKIKSLTDIDPYKKSWGIKVFDKNANDQKYKDIASERNSIETNHSRFVTETNEMFTRLKELEEIK